MKFSKADVDFDLNVFEVFCNENDLRFPNDYVDFLRLYNVALPENNIIYKAINSKHDISIRFFYGISDECYYDIRDNYETYNKTGRMPKKCVSIADPDGGNQVCISLDEKDYGFIYFWDHEIMDCDFGEESTIKTEDMYFIASSFSELIKMIQKIN